ncbi:SsrA-binding protein SmpB [Phenylobacterium sp.]|uniref:SsrA-binding protein SmpB n=1 Tax=Phenylobacterium sp. TaxID=1871053 RepID=UPI00286BEB63|nr:SsrA-binding protein SmpB [Phenylobacterium sp.]
MAAPEQPRKLIAENRRARFDYVLEQTHAAGLALTGSEGKSLRTGRANIAESYAAVQGDEIMLVNADIPPYAQSGPHFNHEPRRHRKLLLKRKEIDKLIGAVQRDGRTIIPIKLFWNDRGLAKLEVALAKGKKEHDKRETTAARDWQRDKARLMKGDRS